MAVERELLRSANVVAGMDEVGRGCLAGPVSVGVVVVDAERRRQPPGIRDSKIITASARERLVPAITRWALASAVGHASAQEIDAIGIIAALRLAGNRALRALPVAHRPQVVVLDGSHDWLTAPQDLLTSLETDRVEADDQDQTPASVVMRVKADRLCTSVAAASVLAKVERDAIMRAEHARDPRYDWAANKGYASPSHIAALARHGACGLHRRSWSLPGVADPSRGVELA
ncbi:ribonuclease HII [Serinibacter salmoneus]|uniref:Ribonuclease n=1 Tax=Serinibacter salmoneus TaxID=556530 RepID=A0A2A9CYV0_9MICO|nr:ribonuclease HII [Serinibacter salmoneus]PFG19311.1 RNase HII [Serinibacter salmoneus]